MQRGKWRPDEIVLTIDGYLTIKNGADRKEIIEAIAKELDREFSAVAAAVSAVGNADPSGGKGPGLIPIARILAEFLLANPRELRRLSRIIRRQPDPDTE